MFHSTRNVVVLCKEDMVSKKWKIDYSLTVSRLKFVSLPIAYKLQIYFHKLPCVEQTIIKLD